MELTDFFNSINKTKKNIVTDDRSERCYVPYVVNKSLSYHKDAIFHVNLMNSNPGLDKKLQYDYYLYGLPKGQRYGKWHKPENGSIGLIMAFYGYSKAKAHEVAKMLSDDQIKAIEGAMYHGGKP